MSGRRIGNYLVTEYIGGGGFGSVFKAEDTTQPGRIVAIKELHKKHTRNAVIKQRFFQEAVAMARLDHPNMPRLFTFGEDNGCYYLVMELISGRVLADELHQNGPMTGDLAASTLAQVLEAVSYAHRNGIIHRDLKPDNIILTNEGGTLRIKVLDFGIARLVGGESLTLAGEGFGTPAYMSPERMWGNTSDDPRIDIYAIGIILFEMLTGRPPFQSTATDPVVYWSEMRSLHESTPLPALAGLGIAAELEGIVQRATAKRPEDRYGSADEMLAELKRVRGEDVGAHATNNLLATAETAQLLLTTAPGGAEVYVDDRLCGTSEVIRGKILIDQLAPGLHTVRVSKPGYSDYKINVALEASQQTDLQVALPARATVVTPPAEATAAGGFGTHKIDSADETKTALLVLESLPAGSTISLGSEVIAAAGEDGRAVLRLAPGAHAVRVTDRNGASATTIINITAADSGAHKTIAVPFDAPATPAARPALPTSPAAAPTNAVALPTVAAPEAGAATMKPATIAAPVARRPEASAGGRRIAYALAAILLMALAAGAYMVFRRPARGDAPPDASATQQAAVGTTPASSTPAANANAGAAATPPAQAGQAPQTEAERTALEKRAAEAERKLKEEQQKQEKSAATPAPATPEPTAPAVTTPTPPPPQAADDEPPPAQGSTCVIVFVSTLSGEPAGGGWQVSVVDESDSSAMYNRRTGQKGRLRVCGLTPGHRVRVSVFGPRGATLGTKTQVLNAGLNLVQLQINREPGVMPQSDAGSPMPFPRKRPRFQRP